MVLYEMSFHLVWIEATFESCWATMNQQASVKCVIDAIGWSYSLEAGQRLAGVNALESSR